MSCPAGGSTGTRSTRWTGAGPPAPRVASACWSPGIKHDSGQRHGGGGCLNDPRSNPLAGRAFLARVGAAKERALANDAGAQRLGATADGAQRRRGWCRFWLNCSRASRSPRRDGHGVGERVVQHVGGHHRERDVAPSPAPVLLSIRVLGTRACQAPHRPGRPPNGPCGSRRRRRLRPPACASPRPTVWAFPPTSAAPASLSPKARWPIDKRALCAPDPRHSPC
jgi:hypothetical protein